MLELLFMDFLHEIQIPFFLLFDKQKGIKQNCLILMPKDSFNFGENLVNLIILNYSGFSNIRNINLLLLNDNFTTVIKHL